MKYQIKVVYRNKKRSGKKIEKEENGENEQEQEQIYENLTFNAVAMWFTFGDFSDMPLRFAHSMFTQ